MTRQRTLSARGAADLRRIAAGVRPARLDEGLLAGWLAFWRVPEPRALLVTDTTGLLVPRPRPPFRSLLGEYGANWVTT